MRQGIGFLRTELPTILATRTDALSPRLLRVIEELAVDWRRLDQRIDGLSGEIEACVGAHHLSRKLASLGHDARLMPAKYVRPLARDRRTTSTMPKRLPKPCSARR